MAEPLIAERCRHKAGEFRRLAKNDASRRVMLEHMAVTWERIATGVRVSSSSARRNARRNAVARPRIG